MAADLVLVQMPGGPYRLTITDLAGERWFTASEMVPGVDGPAWVDVADAPSWHQLTHDLLTRFLRAEVTP